MQPHCLGGWNMCVKSSSLEIMWHWDVFKEEIHHKATQTSLQFIISFPLYNFYLIVFNRSFIFMLNLSCYFQFRDLDICALSFYSSGKFTTNVLFLKIFLSILKFERVIGNGDISSLLGTMHSSMLVSMSCQNGL